MRLCVLAGCPAKTGGPEADAGAVASDSELLVADAGDPDASVAVSDSDAGPAELRLAVLARLSDGGSEWIEREVDAVSALEVALPVGLTNYRLRLFDETDRVVPSDDLAAEVDGGIGYQISLLEPLKAGHSYRLTVEAQQGSELPGYKDYELLLKVRGEPVRDPKKTAAKKKRR